MTVAMMEIFGEDRAGRPILQLNRATRDALAAWTVRRWPNGRRKAIEREWDLSPDEARGIMEATASASTIDKVWKHPRGGWRVALPVLGAVIGHSLEDHLSEERKAVADERAKYAAREAHIAGLEERLQHSRSLRSEVAGPAAVPDGRAAGEPRFFSPRMGGETSD